MYNNSCDKAGDNMEYGDEILLEGYFQYKNMTINERNFCINVLLHTKDVRDSETYVGKFPCSIYDLLFMSFSKDEDGNYNFEGATYSDFENRMVKGVISREGNRYNVLTHVYRCSDYLYDEDDGVVREYDLGVDARTRLNNKKEYTVTDVFMFKNDKVRVVSKYEDFSEIFDAEVEFLDDLELDEYFDNKIKKLKL